MNILTLQKPVGTMAIITHLHKNEWATITDLCKAGINQRSAYSALSSLQNNQLVTIIDAVGFPKRKYYCLTDKGRKIAKHLAMMEKIMA